MLFDCHFHGHMWSANLEPPFRIRLLGFSMCPLWAGIHTSVTDVTNAVNLFRFSADATAWLVCHVWVPNCRDRRLGVNTEFYELIRSSFNPIRASVVFVTATTSSWKILSQSIIGIWRLLLFYSNISCTLTIIKETYYYVMRMRKCLKVKEQDRVKGQAL